MERRKFLQKAILGGLVLIIPSLERSNEQLSWDAQRRKKFINDMRISITSAFWNDSKDAANKFKERYDSVWIPGISINEDGTLEESLRTKDALIEGKPNFCMSGNY